MKSIFLLVIASVFVVACGNTQNEGEGTETAASGLTTHTTQTGSSSGTLSGEIIGSDLGYIIENARITGDQSTASYNLKNVLKISTGPSAVLIVRTQTVGGATEFLALEFPRFADGTAVDFIAGEDNASFSIFGVKDGAVVMKQTGSVEGSMRMIKTAPSQATLGMQRKLTDGVGEMEIVVSGIDSNGLDIPQDKKYAARFTLPLITLDELAKINQPI